METNEPVKSSRLNISLSWPVVAIVLLGVIVGMLMLWRPWESKASSSDRTVSVEGDAKIKAEPDQFNFHPNYQFKNADKETALAELTKKSEEVSSGLKKLGVADNKIKTDSDGNNYEYFYDSQEKLNNYSLRFTVEVDNKELAQKVQDYLLTSKPLGSVSPQATFSDKKRKELESQARDEATKDARSKADQSAKNLGFKIDKVKNIEDGNNFGDYPTMMRGAELSLDAGQASDQKLAVQPGENELSYRVKVTYYIK